MSEPMRKINVKILKDGEIELDTILLGMQNEKNATKLVFEVPPELEDFNKTIEFAFANGNKYTDIIFNNEYILDNNITCSLFVSFQVSFTDKEGNTVFKTIWKDCIFEKSINATDPPPTAEEVSIYNRLITELNDKIKEADDTLTKLEEDVSSGKFKGEKGDKGDAGSIKFIIVAELPTEDIDETAIYMKQSTNQEELNTYEEFIYVNGAWESLGIAQVEVDLTDYVKNTDFATRTTVGVVKASEGGGIGVSSSGNLMTVLATDSEIDEKTNTFKVIVPKNLEKAVKSVGDGYYVTFTDYVSSTTPGIVNIGSGMGIWVNGNKQLYLVKATNAEIDKRVSNYTAIVPSNLQYAVESVVGGHVVLTQAEYDALETKDENTFYYIKEE